MFNIKCKCCAENINFWNFIESSTSSDFLFYGVKCPKCKRTFLSAKFSWVILASVFMTMYYFGNAKENFSINISGIEHIYVLVLMLFSMASVYFIWFYLLFHQSCKDKKI